MKYLLLIGSLLLSSWTQAEVQHFARFQYQGQIHYGLIQGKQIQTLTGDIFADYVLTEQKLPLNKVRLLLPAEPQKVFAVGMNFASHLSSPSDEPPPLFLKLPTSLIASGKVIQLPADADNVHFEGELVLIIGKQAKNLSEAEAEQAIFAVTVGNDLTDRNWQSQDLQWLRAKASDGFAPIAPIMAVGADYNNLLLTTRLNGKVVQQENTRHMIHKPAKVVSYLSRYFTLMPGDLVFMGTPGRTKALNHGDKVSVRIEQVGTVENQIQTQR